MIFDQVGTPTYASDLAKTCLDILISEKFRNISLKENFIIILMKGVASWYDFATAIMELGSRDCKVKPIETKTILLLAKRPHYSVLNKSKIKTDFNIEIPYWRDSLERCIEKLKSN